MMNRWSLSISTTAAVVLFTLSAQLMLEQENYLMAGLFFIFAFLVPLQSEGMRDKLLKSGRRTQNDDEVEIGSGSAKERGDSDAF